MKKSSASGMNHGKNSKVRGRTDIHKLIEPAPTNPPVPERMMTEVNRGVTANGNMNKHRGDRRDTNTYYTGTAKHSARGNTPRKDVSTRAR